MSARRHAHRRDAIEKDIIEALRQLGADVTPISGPGAPDLLIRYQGRLLAWEVKSSQGKRTKAQQASQWPIVRSTSEALAQLHLALQGDDR